MKIRISGLALMMLLVLSLLFVPAVVAGDNKEKKTGEIKAEDVEKVTDRLNSAAEVLDEIMKVPEKGIPKDLLEKAECVAIVPGMIKGGFIVGAKWGKGAVSCRQGGRWGAPLMIEITGGSIGLQIGGQATDLVMLVMNERGKSMFYRDKFTVGAGVAATAGPVGRDASAETNARLRAEILTYSRSRGLFAGATIGGASVRPDKSDNRALYGRDVMPRKILVGAVEPPSAAGTLLAALRRHDTERRAAR